MALKPDFQNALKVFIFSNLPILMNPTNAMNIVVSTTIGPITPITPITPTVSAPITSTTPIATAISTTTTTVPPIVITPDTLQALQTYVLNNFPDLGLPQDIQQVAKEFFANLPTVVPVVSPVAPISSPTSVTSATP